jgi:hypothetical protein
MDHSQAAAPYGAGHTSGGGRGRVPDGVGIKRVHVYAAMKLDAITKARKRQGNSILAQILLT